MTTMGDTGPTAPTKTVKKDAKPGAHRLKADSPAQFRAPYLIKLKRKEYGK